MATAEERIQRELNTLRATVSDSDTSPIANVGPISDDNLLHWRATLIASEGPLSSGKFVLDMRFPVNYPYVPVKLVFITPIYRFIIQT